MSNSTPASSENGPTIEQSLRELGKYGFSQTPPETLEKMSSQIDVQLEQLRGEAAELNAQVGQQLEAGDPHVFSELKKKLSYLRGQIEDRVTKRQRISNTLEHHHMMDKMADLLGSRKRVTFLEGFVLVLIVLVLGLLVYDYTAPTTWAEFHFNNERLVRVADPTSREQAWQQLVEKEPGLQESAVVKYQTTNARPNWLTSSSIFWIDACCCLIFMIEFFLRRSCAQSKKWFWRNHWIDFFTSIPVPGEAQLARFGRVARVARFARVLRFTRIIRALRVFLLLWRGMDKLQDTMDVKLMKRSLKWGLVVMVIGGLLVFQLERGMAEKGNDVTTIGGGMWWSFTTIVTGGFGDIHNPLTLPGRLLTVLLVVTGMILVGVFTATLTSLYVGEESEEMQRHQDEMNDRLDRMGETLSQLSEKLND